MSDEKYKLFEALYSDLKEENVTINIL